MSTPKNSLLITTAEGNDPIKYADTMRRTSFMDISIKVGRQK
jgi:hypothetical protein